MQTELRETRKLALAAIDASTDNGRHRRAIDEQIGLNNLPLNKIPSRKAPAPGRTPATQLAADDATYHPRRTPVP